MYATRQVLRGHADREPTLLARLAAHALLDSRGVRHVAGGFNAMTHTFAKWLSPGLTLLVLVVAGAQVASAQSAQQPSIAGISGSVTQGSLLTISGANLNSETKQGWDGFYSSHPTAWSFEGPSPTSDGFSGLGPAGTAYDSTVKLLGNQSAKFHIQGATSNCPAGYATDYDAFNLTNLSHDLWIRTYVRWRANSTDWPKVFIKMLRIGNGPGAFHIQPVNGPTIPSSFYAQYESTSSVGQGVWANLPGGQIQNNRWYLVELHVKNSSPTAFTAWIDGTQIFSRTDPLTGPVLETILFGFINLCDTTSAFNLEHWFDGFAIGSSRIHGSAIVEVGNSSNYSTATKKVQALERIADDQIVFKLDTSGLGSGPYYLWVRNNAQQLSAAHFLGGQSSGPPAPTNLHIVP
jgi:hypothetical protein